MANDTDQWNKLFAYLERRFKAIEDSFEDRFAENQRAHDKIFSILDTLAGHDKDAEDERLMINRRLDVHERWLLKLTGRASLR